MTRKMKDSGIEWIGEIPEDWKISKIKYVSNLNGRIGFRGYKESDLVDEDEGAITLGPPNMDDGKLNLSNCKYLSWYKYFESPEIQLSIGDILLVKTASVGKVAYVDNIKKEMTINPQLLIIKSRNIENKFLFYIMISDYFQNQIKMSVTGGTVPTLSQEKIKNFTIIEPSLSSQKLIAKKIDLKCSKLEEISNIIKKQIQILEDYKKSIITEAVTKGLDKNVEIKDSGIEWVGEIPKHWQVDRLKNIVNYNEQTLKETTNKNYRFKYIDIGSVEYGKEILPLEIMTFEKAPSRARRIVKGGDIIISTVRTYLKAIAVVPKSDMPIIASTGFITLRTKGIVDQEYLKYVVQSETFISEISSKSVGVNYPAINATELINIKIAIPPKEERLKIISHLDKKARLIDEAIANKQKQLETLEEYKKSLIYEYVTGKKEVE